jgi:hypothetical protein
VLLAVLACGRASAQEPITDNEFNVDGVTGPILAGSSILGMGGAYAALATGISGLSWTPAAPGSRALWEVDWFQWEIAFSFLSPGGFSEQDYFNNDRGEGFGVDQFLFLETGLRLQFGEFGTGLLFNWQTFDVEPPGGVPLTVALLTSRFGGAWGFLDGQLVAGLGLRASNLTVHDTEAEDKLITFTGLGVEAGVLVRLEGYPWRIGAAFRSPARARINPNDMPDVDPVTGVESVSGLILPSRFELPWEIQLGAAWQFGPRPFNTRWVRPIDPEEVLTTQLEDIRCDRVEAQLRREMEAAGETPPATMRCPMLPRQPRDPTWMAEEAFRRGDEDAKLEESIGRLEEEISRNHERFNRRYYLISAELLMIGRTEDGIGVDAFLDQEIRPAGDDLSFGLRVGFEFEPWRNRLKLRVGSYLEPPRSETGEYRVHGTGGFDLRLFRIAFLKANVAVTGVFDVAPRYFDFGIGIGFWH